MITKEIVTKELTASEKILLAAESIEKKGISPFTAEQLVVTTWQLFYETFGLKQFAEKYPDSNKVLSSVMGEKGLVRRGWLVKMGQKLYALTREGRNVIRRVMDQEEEKAPGGNVQRMSRDHDRFLKVLFDSSAVQKFEGNRKHELSFADARRFWGVTENMKGELLDEKIEETQKMLNDLDRILDGKNSETSSGRVVTIGDVHVLSAIHCFLKNNFKRHLQLQREGKIK